VGIGNVQAGSANARGLGRTPLPPDPRRLRPHNRMRQVLAGPAAAPVTKNAKTWTIFRKPLDQGYTSSCEGHAWKHRLMAAPIIQYGGPDAMTIYREAQKRDPWPGEEPYFQGTDTEAPALYLREIGMLERFVWADSLEEIVQWVLTEGPVVLGTDWWSGMDDPDDKGYLRAIGTLRGGHAWLLIGVNQKLRRFTMLNSWGPGWARNGRAYVSYDTVQHVVFDSYGEAVAPTELRKVFPKAA
jgi:hypothetical protein